jgi:hypothetical protein
MGRNAEEFGQAAIRTQWRNVDALGDNAQLFGKPTIADRNRKVMVHSFNAGGIGSLRVCGTGSPPLSTQYIFLNNVENQSEDDDTNTIKDGQGIAVPFGQVPNPSLRSNVIKAGGFNTNHFGETNIHSNGILMENGIKLDKECGSPTVQLSRRTIAIEGISNIIVIGTPRLSPHTIYAVLEATEQAQINHKVSGTLHAVNSDMGTRNPGEVFGNTIVWMHNPYLNVHSVKPLNLYGTPTVQLKRRYIDVKGIQAYRFGWHKLGDGTQEVTHQQGLDFSSFGKATIVLEKDKQVQVRVEGITSLVVAKPLVEFFHRNIVSSGFNSLEMGYSRGQNFIYMPQSLHIGFPMPVKPAGNLMEKFGTTYIGLKVRDIRVEGFESTFINYDLKNFNARMRVERGKGGSAAPVEQMIQSVGFDALRSNASNVKYAVQYIRPDGNSDQFRKGAF